LPGGVVIIAGFVGGADNIVGFIARRWTVPACDPAFVSLPVIVAALIVGSIVVGVSVEGGGGDGATALAVVNAGEPTTSSDLASSTPGPPL
jgi:hypothetical protein